MTRKKLIYLLLSISNLYFGQTLQWAKNMGGLSSEYGRSIAVDASGNVYTTGYFQGTADFDPSAGTFTLSESGSNDIFISKLDASGNFAWAKRIGSFFLEEGVSISVDGSSNVYVTGRFYGTVDFDPGAGTFNLISAGSYDIFILKLDVNGNFIWAKSMGGNGDDDGKSITVDASGNVYSSGRFQTTGDFDPGAGTFTLTSSGNWDIFVSKLNSSGNFVWAKSIGGSSGDGVNSLKIDASGNVYTAGSFSGTVDFDPGAGVFNLTPAGTGAVFILKLDASGNFVWAKNIGGAFSTYVMSILADQSGNIYATGHFQGTVDFDPGVGTFSLTTVGWNDTYISKLDTSGNFIWAKSFGGNSSDVYGSSIAEDGTGNIYSFGNFSGAIDFDPGAGTYSLTSPINDEIFISKLDASGSFVWAKSIGGTSNNYGHALVIDALDNIYITGGFGGTSDFDPDAGVSNLTSIGVADIFVSKIGMPVGIKENSYASNISIYPNPNSGLFRLQVDKEIKDGELILYNSTGQRVFEQKIAQGSNDINAIELSKGLYNFILLSDKQKIIGGKLVVD